MQLIDPIEIDLLDFIKTGKFDYIKPGQTKAWISQNFPDPDDKDMKNQIWCYGNIEFHFRKDETLFMIFSDYIDSFNGGNNLRLKKWIFNDPDKLTMEYVGRNLTKERVTYKTVFGSLSSGYSTTAIEIIPSRVTMTFALPEAHDEDFQEYEARTTTEDPNIFELSSVSLSSE